MAKDGSPPESSLATLHLFVTIAVHSFHAPAIYMDDILNT